MTRKGPKNLWPSSGRFAEKAPGASTSDGALDARSCGHRCCFLLIQGPLPCSGLPSHSRRRDLMQRFLARFTVLLPDTDSARVGARIKSGCDKQGRPIAFADVWIAAAAVQLNVPLVTHNASDFRAVESLTILTAAAAIQ